MKTYFIANGPAAPGTQVKIGRSENPTERLAQLQTASSLPLSLLFHINGDREHEFHRRFAKDRLEGEWFEWTQDLQEFIERDCYDFESNLLKLLTSEGSTYTLSCPLCRFTYHHFNQPPEVSNGNYDCRTTKQIRIKMDGECGHTWWLVLECYKGQAQLSVSAL